MRLQNQFEDVLKVHDQDVRPKDKTLRDETEGRTLTRESNSEHTASIKTSNIPFAWFLKE